MAYVDDDADEAAFPGPPKQFLAVLLVELLVSGACFAVASRPANWVGYVVGAWLAALTTIAYRHADRRRSADPAYVPERWVGRVVAGLLLVGLMLAALHSYFLAKVVVFL